MIARESLCRNDTAHGATYRLLPQTRDDAYAVEVSVRGMLPTTVSGFITQASAERWVAERVGSRG